MNKQVLDKIRKLLKLSESPNEHEAQKAIMKAQELAYKHGVEIAELGSAEDVVVSEQASTVRRRIPLEERLLASILADNFRVKVFGETTYKGTSIIVIGLNADVEIFLAVFSFVIKSYRILLRSFMNEFKKEHPRVKRIARVKNAYLSGFASGLREKFKENVEKYALSVITPEPVEKAFNAKNMKDTNRGKKASVSQDASVWIKGYDDSKTIEMHKSLSEA